MPSQMSLVAVIANIRAPAAYVSNREPNSSESLIAIVRGADDLRPSKGMGCDLFLCSRDIIATQRQCRFVLGDLRVAY